MSEANVCLYVASYEDAETADQDYKALKAAQAAENFAVVGAVVMSRAADGTVDVSEHGPTATKAGAVLGGTAGVVVGLFAPPLLLSAGWGTAIGAGIGALVKRHEEKQIGVDVEQVLPPGSSAVVVVVDDIYLDSIDRALRKATKRVTKAVESGDIDKIEDAITRGAGEIADSVEES